MAIPAGTHKLGPDNASLRVKTGVHGAAAKAGHNLVIDVTSWEATLEVGDDPGQTSLELTADGGSLRVLEGSGGAKALSEDDKADIKKTIDKDVLERQAVEFRSTHVEPSEGGSMRVSGDLTMVGKTHPIDFELADHSDGQLGGSATVKQTDWKIKPYSALFGALKATDEVEIVVEARLPSA